MLSGEMTTSLDERRAHARYDLQLALSIETPTRPGRFGVSRNTSASGILFQTPSRFVPGEDLSLTVLLPRGLAILATGHVLRVANLDATVPWRFLIAAKFEDEVPLLGEVLRTLAAKGYPSSQGIKAVRP